MAMLMLMTDILGNININVNINATQRLHMILLAMIA